MWENEKMLITAFLSFLTLFSTPSKSEIVILAIFILSSASVLNLEQGKILSFGKELSTCTLAVYEECTDININIRKNIIEK